MNTKLILLAITLTAFGSCTTIYKSGQTPDDVYYSPVRSFGEDLKEDQPDEVQNTYNYRNEEMAIRMGINDYRWRYFDNNYYYNPYSFGYNRGYYYNPYFWPYPVYNPIYITPNPVNINTTPRKANLAAYNAPIRNTNITNSKTGNVRNTRTYNNSNNGSAVGNVMRQIFQPGNNNTNNSNGSNNSSSNNTRSYTPSSNSGSTGNRSSSGSGGISRPSRGGGN